ncbi:MAG: peptide chain release factor N(5)-glutamine methyltransferase [Terracidiphilus sp.]
MTLRDFLEYGESQLSVSPHPDRAIRDAETLLLHLIGKNKAWLMAHANDDFAGCSAIRYASLLERRCKGEPLQYIIGEVEFYRMPFRVTPEVLIPRPETEHLVEKTIALAVALEHPRILDIGTGSGAIAVSLAQNLPNAQITATDVSSSALAIAEDNARRNAVTIRFLQGDVLIPVAGETFDLIVSNPPYVSAADRDSLSVEVRDHEPSLALFAGNDGLEIYRRLIPQAFAALAPGGFIALEIGYGQQPAIQRLLAIAGFTNIEFTPDLQGIPRVAVAQRI